MTFINYLTERLQLQENTARAAAISLFGLRSKNAGDRSAAEFQRGRSALRVRGIGVDARLTRIETALDALLGGMGHAREQAGNGVAVNVTGHLLQAQNLEALKNQQNSAPRN